jgi:hypothetical protein
VLRRLIWVLLSPETRRELSFSLSQMVETETHFLEYLTSYTERPLMSDAAIFIFWPLFVINFIAANSLRQFATV